MDINADVPWVMGNLLPEDAPVWALVEALECNLIEPPKIRRVLYFSGAPDDKRYKILDYDPVTEVSHIRPSREAVVAWRPLTNHNGTWDQYLINHDVSEFGNWTLAFKLDKIRKSRTTRSLLKRIFTPLQATILFFTLTGIYSLSNFFIKLFVA